MVVADARFDDPHRVLVSPIDRETRRFQMATLEMPHVSECSVSSCSYNHDGCHAFAINVGGSNGTADCGTFIPLSVKGGLDVVSPQVGACQRSDCRHNANLECTAAAVRIGAGESSDTANCLTYSKA